MVSKAALRSNDMRRVDLPVSDAWPHKGFYIGIALINQSAYF